MRPPPSTSPLSGLEDALVQPEALAKVPARLALHYLILPLRMEGRRLQLAMTDPTDVQRRDELKLVLGCEIEPVPAGEEEIRVGIQRAYGIGAEAIERLLGLDQDQPVSSASRPPTEDLAHVMDEASMATFVNELIVHAVRDRATDIHIEPYGDVTRIRQRIDGLLYELPVPKGLIRLHQVLVSRIKIMAQLNITERRLPQDGRITVRLDGQDLDLRVSILPTSFGESADIRILSSRMLYDLEKLGLSAEHLQRLNELIARPHGIVFVTGPTGSGKTTTLYSCLAKLNAVERKILTIEDPIEYQLSGISQIQIHQKIGLSFAQGLRSMLRHDPDIMMVGEVRDPETAEITIRSALTGHLVFSTLHTNDASGGIARLLDMGIEPYLVTSSVLCFIAQRLVRVICQACREVGQAPTTLREQFGVEELPKQLAHGRGCAVCKGTGFRGRTAIYEFLMVEEAVQQLILRRASAGDIRRMAQQAGPPAADGSRRAGMRTLRQDGWLKIVAGLTTPEEVLRVT